MFEREKTMLRRCRQYFWLDLAYILKACWISGISWIILQLIQSVLTVCATGTFCQGFAEPCFVFTIAAEGKAVPSGWVRCLLLVEYFFIMEFFWICLVSLWLLPLLIFLGNTVLWRCYVTIVWNGLLNYVFVCMFVYFFLGGHSGPPIGENAVCLLICFKFLFLDLNFLWISFFFSLILEMNYLWVVIFDQVNFDLCSDKKIFR